jgi:hypothetical protein
MKNQLIEKANIEKKEEQNVLKVDIDRNQKQSEQSLNKSAIIGGVLYVVIIILIFLVIFSNF